jgi:tRNA (guanine37-N1)-methyltransferase
MDVKHILMNLPATAVEFLDVFGEVRKKKEERHTHTEMGGEEKEGKRETQTNPQRENRGNEKEEDDEEEEEGLFDYLTERPFVHVYCFSKAEDPTTEALERASAILGYTFKNGEGGVSVHRVRDVAPKKEMLCLSFPLPRYGELMVKGGEEGERGRKRRKVEGEEVGEG